MSSVRHRISTLLRRSSLVGDKDKDKNADSGSERDPNSRPGSPSPSLRRGSGEAGSKRRKRVSFSSFRGRSGTSDAVDHSQLAKEVVNAINTDSNDKPAQEQQSSSDEPVVAVVALPADASIEQAKTESSLEAASLQDSNDHHVVPVAHEEQRAAEEVVEPVVETPQVVITEPQPEVPVEETKTENLAASEEFNEVQVSSTMIMRDSPSHSMVNIAVIEPAPAYVNISLFTAPFPNSLYSFPEPATYDTSFTSSSSNAGPSLPPPISMPVPRPIGQPLSAIDELRAKGHPVTDWTQKDDVNYDADADEYVKVMSLFFLLPAVIFLGLPYLFSYPAVLELASM